MKLSFVRHELQGRRSLRRKYNARRGGGGGRCVWPRVAPGCFAHPKSRAFWLGGGSEAGTGSVGRGVGEGDGEGATARAPGL